MQLVFLDEILVVSSCRIIFHLGITFIIPSLVLPMQLEANLSHSCSNFTCRCHCSALVMAAQKFFLVIQAACAQFLQLEMGTNILSSMRSIFDGCTNILSSMHSIFDGCPNILFSMHAHNFRNEDGCKYSACILLHQLCCYKFHLVSFGINLHRGWKDKAFVRQRQRQRQSKKGLSRSRESHKSHA